MKPIRILLLSLVAFCGFSLAGCGNEKTTTLKVGLECNYAPFNWTENSSNSNTLPIANHSGSYADGYDIQLCKYLSKKLNCNIEIYQTSWDSLIPDLQNNAIDLVIAGMTDTEERRESIDFTNEYYHSELVLVTKKEVSSKYNSSLNKDELKELINGKYLVSQKGTLTNDIIDTFVKEYSCIKATEQSSFALCATDVSNGSVFAMTSELPVANSIVSSNPNLGIVHIDQDILGEEQANLGVSIGLRKGSTELKDKINQALESLSETERIQMMTDAVNRSNSGNTSNPSIWKDIGDLIKTSWQQFLIGLGGTILLSVFGTLVGLFFGVFLAFGKNLKIDLDKGTKSQWWKYVIKWLCNIYSVVIRGTPMMVQAMIFKYGCQMLGVNWNTVLPGVPVFNGWMIAGLVVITFNTSAYMGEIVKSGLNGIGKDQIEGAKSLGMSPLQTLFIVTLPQAIRNSIPTIGNEWIVNIKDSSVLNIIGVTELFFMTQQSANKGYKFMAAYLIVAVIYLLLTLVTTGILKYVEMKMDGKKIEFKLFNRHFKESRAN